MADFNPVRFRHVDRSEADRRGIRREGGVDYTDEQCSSSHSTPESCPKNLRSDCSSVPPDRPPLPVPDPSRRRATREPPPAVRVRPNAYNRTAAASVLRRLLAPSELFSPEHARAVLPRKRSSTRHDMLDLRRRWSSSTHFRSAASCAAQATAFERSRANEPPLRRVLTIGLRTTRNAIGQDLRMLVKRWRAGSISASAVRASKASCSTVRRWCVAASAGTCASGACDGRNAIGCGIGIGIGIGHRDRAVSVRPPERSRAGGREQSWRSRQRGRIIRAGPGRQAPSGEAGGRLSRRRAEGGAERDCRVRRPAPRSARRAANAIATDFAEATSWDGRGRSGAFAERPADSESTDEGDERITPHRRWQGRR